MVKAKEPKCEISFSPKQAASLTKIESGDALRPGGTSVLKPTVHGCDFAMTPPFINRHKWVWITGAALGTAVLIWRQFLTNFVTSGAGGSQP